MSGRTLAIVNPAAGGGRCGKAAPAAIADLRAQGLPIDVVETRGPGEGVVLARKAYRDGVRDFIAVGGDGTGYEIVNGLFPEALSGQLPSLGFLPLGTGNSFLRDFTQDGVQYARRALIEQKRRRVDVIQLEHREGSLYFINLVSLGFVADVCSVTNRRFKPLGEAGYGLGVVATVAGLSCQPIPLGVDGGGIDSAPQAFVSLCNSRFTGGKMMMAPAADPGDGRLDVISVGALGRLSLVRTFPKIFDGSHVRHPAVRTARAKTVEFRLSGPADVMVDGEVLRIWPVRATVLEHSLEVCA